MLFSQPISIKKNGMTPRSSEATKTGEYLHTTRNDPTHTPTFSSSPNSVPNS